MTVTTHNSDVTIVGAGPVGLFLANLLAEQAFSVTIIEKRASFPCMSMAIGVTPPSLSRLSEIGMDKPLISQGLKIDEAYVYENRVLVGQLGFDHVASPYPYILSIPQSVTTELLSERALKHSNISVIRPAEFITFTENETGITAEAFSTIDGKNQFHSAAIIGCDGCRSGVRQTIGQDGRIKTYKQRWIMADYTDRINRSNTASLYFSSVGSVESFPLPDQKRRWILQRIGPRSSETERFALKVEQQTEHGLSLETRDSVFHEFGAQRYIALSYGRGRAFLCGDAAHIMSSIGGHGLNVGFGDAHMLASLLPEIFRGRRSYTETIDLYTRARRRAALRAARGAAMSMAFGTASGMPASWLRKTILTRALKSAAARRFLAGHFSMIDGIQDTLSYEI